MAKLHSTLDELIAKAIEQFPVAAAPSYPLIGGWGDEAELVDEIVADIIRDRGRHD